MGGDSRSCPRWCEQSKAKKKDASGRPISLHAGLVKGSTLGAANTDLPPVPPQAQLDRQLAVVLDSMNIPKAKAQEFMQSSNEKKWQLVTQTNCSYP